MGPDPQKGAADLPERGTNHLPFEAETAERVLVTWPQPLVEGLLKRG